MTVSPEALRQAPLFASLAPDDLAAVAAVTVERRYGRGDIIILAGEEGGGLYLVRRGLVKVYRTSEEGKEQTLRLIDAGTTFNDVPALDGGVNPASAMAMEPTMAYVTSGLQLRRLIAERPGIAQATVRTMAMALRGLVALIEDLSFRSVRARVAKILLEQEQASVRADATSDAAPARHRLTQQEIAALAGTAREMVGRALKELEAAGAIHNEHGRITILSDERLRALAM
ncbi:MAG TPA: Crp/Fnr family transcriptional regulator [Ktedonobacterales bacterium]|jgi:CRP/FNR family transcriptional regulator|nr:Crp/Fnr family transcriptional regulator [Ktedonobacterales bacterium]